MKHTIDELTACVKREIAMRHKVYPSRIAAGKMTTTDAQHEIECMNEVLEIVKKHKDRQIPLLTESAF